MGTVLIVLKLAKSFSITIFPMSRSLVFSECKEDNLEETGDLVEPVPFAKQLSYTFRGVFRICCLIHYNLPSRSDSLLEFVPGFMIFSSLVLSVNSLMYFISD